MKRRKFLTQSTHVALSSGYFYGLQALLETCFKANLAQAAEVAGPGYNYVNFQLPGAPPRWYFDQPLNPFNRANDIIAGTFGTEIVKNGANYNPVLRGHKLNFGSQEVFMPPVWNLNSASGVPFKNLLDHTMMIRGIDMEINSHPVNRSRIVRPVNSNPSITGLVADKSNRPLAAVGHSEMDATKAYKSETGSSVTLINSGAPVADITRPFITDVTKAEDLKHQIVRTVADLDGYALDNGMASMGSEKQQMAAYEMFARNLDSFNTRWATLYKKYQDIIAAEIRSPFPGITNVNPVGDGTSEIYRYDRTATTILNGSFASQITATTSNNRMAQAFAFAEFALTEKLSSSVTVASTSIMDGLRTIRVNSDQHFIGANVSIYYTSLMYKALLGCMTEFVSVLKTENIFDNTVIHIMSEFSRTPKASGAGSDHGFRGGSTTIISGMITTPGLVGNIVKRSSNPTTATSYPGTWGESAHFFKSPDRHLVNDDICHTICEMLEIRKVAVKGQSLIRKTGGRVEWSQNWEVKNV